MKLSAKIIGLIVILCMQTMHGGMPSKDTQVKANTLLAQLGRMTFQTPAEQRQGRHVAQLLETLGSQNKAPGYVQQAQEWKQLINDVEKGDVVIDRRTGKQIRFGGMSKSIEQPIEKPVEQIEQIEKKQEEEKKEMPQGKPEVKPEIKVKPGEKVEQPIVEKPVVEQPKVEVKPEVIAEELEKAQYKRIQERLAKTSLRIAIDLLEDNWTNNVEPMAYYQKNVAGKALEEIIKNTITRDEAEMYIKNKLYIWNEGKEPGERIKKEKLDDVISYIMQLVKVDEDDVRTLTQIEQNPPFSNALDDANFKKALNELYHERNWRENFSVINEEIVRLLIAEAKRLIKNGIIDLDNMVTLISNRISIAEMTMPPNIKMIPAPGVCKIRIKQFINVLPSFFEEVVVKPEIKPQGGISTEQQQLIALKKQQFAELLELKNQDYLDNVGVPRVDWINAVARAAINLITDQSETYNDVINQIKRSLDTYQQSVLKNNKEQIDTIKGELQILIKYPQLDNAKYADFRSLLLKIQYIGQDSSWVFEPGAPSTRWTNKMIAAVKPLQSVFLKDEIMNMINTAIDVSPYQYKNISNIKTKILEISKALS